MKKKIFNPKKTAAGLALLAVLGTTTMTAWASDDNYGFSFTLKPGYGNSYVEQARYRQTTNTNNRWKVNLQYHEAGSGKSATFWLAKAEGKAAVSAPHDVAQGTGAHYYTAYSSASQTDVTLGAENAKSSSKSYKISGVWDEETN